MRIIDKYLLREFIAPLLYTFDAFLMLFIVQDLLDKLTDFITFHAKVSQVLHYYLIVLPEAIVMILPMAMLLAVLFCLANLGKNNELIALRASGVSTLRLAAPFLIVGAVAAVAVFVINETLVPRSREKAEAFMNELRGRGTRTTVVNFFYANTADRRDWYVRQFNTVTKQLTGVEIHQRTLTGQPLLDIFAQEAVWTNSQWRFNDADVYDYLKTPEVVAHVATTNIPAFHEAPKELALEGRKPAQLLTRELRRHIATLEQSRRTDRLSDYRVELETRYALPFTALIIIWLAIPLGMRVSKRGALVGVGVALGLTLAYFILTQITQALGRGEHVPPVVAAWSTNAIFAGIGAVLMWRAR